MVQFLFKPLSPEALVSKRMLGIHIQDDSMAIVGIQKKNGQKEQFTDAQVIKTQQLKAALKNFKATYKDACIDVAGNYVTTEQMTFPLMSPRELLSAIKVKLETTVGETFEQEYYWNFTPLHHLSKSEQNVLIVLVKRDHLDQQLKILTDAGLRPVGAEFMPYAYWKSIQHATITQDKDKNQSYALLYTDSSYLHISIFEGHTLAFYRCLPKNLKSIFTHLNADPELPLTTEHNSLIQDLVSEIQQSFEYAIEHQSIKTIQRIFIAGDSNHVTKLSSLLSAQLGVPVELADPAPNYMLPSELESSLRTHRSQLVVATGCTQEGPSLSLLPAKFKLHVNRYAKEAILKRIAMMCATLVVSLMGLTMVYRTHLDRQYQANQNMLTTLQTTLAGLTRAREMEQQLEQEHQALMKVFGVNMPLHLLMFEISNIIPERMLLTQMNYSQELGNMELEGISYYAKGESEQRLAQFIRAIETSSYFSHARLAYFKRKVEGSPSASTFLIQVAATLSQPQRSPTSETQSQ